MQKELLEEAYGKDGSRRMPIDHRVEDSLETDGLQMASVHTAISENNVGFQMLQRMGWKGQGLGSKEDGGHKQLMHHTINQDQVFTVDALKHDPT